MINQLNWFEEGANLNIVSIKIHDDIFINELEATIEDEEAGIQGHSKKWQLVRDGLNYFRQHNAEAYMVLLD